MYFFKSTKHSFPQLIWNLLNLILQSVVSTGSTHGDLFSYMFGYFSLYADYCTLKFILEIHWSLGWSCFSPKTFCICCFFLRPSQSGTTLSQVHSSNFPELLRRCEPELQVHGHNLTGKDFCSPTPAFFFFLALNIAKPVGSHLNMGKSSDFRHNLVLLCFALLRSTDVVFYKLKARPSTLKKITTCDTLLPRSGTEPALSPRYACTFSALGRPWRCSVSKFPHDMKPLKSKHKCSLLANPLG